jgi:serine/threonine protein kinase
VDVRAAAASRTRTDLHLEEIDVEEKHPELPRLSAFLKGQLDRRSSGELEQHLEVCGYCRERIEGIEGDSQQRPQAPDQVKSAEDRVAGAGRASLAHGPSAEASENDATEMSPASEGDTPSLMDTRAAATSLMDTRSSQVIDALCGEYAQRWSAEGRPPITAYLERVGAQYRSELLLKLLNLDVRLRRIAGGEIHVRQYAELGEDAIRLVRRLLDGESDPGNAAVEAERSNALQGAMALSERAASNTRIGPYKLLEQIGEGGMGVVWVAEQEQPVRRRVALKLIKGGMGSKETLARFEAERQALAMMDHQNIAKVLDAGTTEFGGPYFVMELVKGLPLTKYCDRNKLSIRERLELLIPVCHAVQHAHQKGIIHRDLKPSNVLVSLNDGKPVPKVIDFGLAKALEHTTKLTDKTMFTALGKIIGTLRYMSPEQAGTNVQDVDTRTDVYAIGVMLYELLAGSTPLDRETLAKCTLHEVLDLIRESEPPRPSSRLSALDDAAAGEISQRRKITPARLHQILRGELDWIVMKALEHDRTRRYESARDLADDMNRYLHGEAVAARPPSAGYRLRKFVNKNRVLVGVTGGVFALLVAGIAGVSWFNEELKESNAKLQQSLEETRITIDQYVDTVMNDELLREKRFQPTAEKLLADAVSHYKRYVEQYQHDKGSLDKVTQSLRRISLISQRCGRLNESLEASNLEVELLRNLLEASPDDGLIQWELANALKRLGSVARALNDAGLAEDSLTQASELMDAVAGDTSSKDFRVDHLWALASLLELYMDQNDDARITQLIPRVEQMAAALRADFEDDIQVRKAARGVLLNKAIYIATTQGPVQALPAFEKCVEFSTEDLKLDPQDEGLRSNKATDLYNLGITLMNAGRPDDAVPLQEQAAVLFEKLVTDFPLVKIHQTFLADTYQKLAEIKAGQRDFAAAEEMMERAVEMHGVLVAKYPDEATFGSRMANQINLWGEMLLEQEDYAKALAKFAEAFELLSPIVAKNPAHFSNQYRLARAARNRGLANARLGNSRSALDDFALSVRTCLDFRNLPMFPELMQSAVVDAATLEDDDRQLQPSFATFYDLLKPELDDTTTDVRLAAARLAVMADQRQDAERMLESLVATVPQLTGEQCFAGARVAALAAKYASADNGRNPAERSIEAKRLVGNAVSLLDEALETGFFDDARQRSLLQSDTDLQSLREYGEFQEFLDKAVASRN